MLDKATALSATNLVVISTSRDKILVTVRDKSGYVSKTQPDYTMNPTIRVALDWTPNTNHTGFYVALANGYYAEAGVEVALLSPEADRYKTSPAKRVVQGEADLAITPTESIISYQLNGIPLVAVGAILARDASAIVTLKQSRLDRPGKLDGKVYASYNARFEDEIVRQMVRNDGGRGNLVIHHSPRLGIWNTLLTGEADATWIFLPWEGVEAELKDVALNTFTLDEFEIPYGYSPVLAAHKDWIEANADALRWFMAATAKGFLFAAQQPEEAARLLMEIANHPTLANADFVEASQQSISSYYLDEQNRWGVMKPDVWSHFVHWMIRHRMLNTKDGEVVQHMDIQQLYTNWFVEN